MMADRAARQFGCSSHDERPNLNSQLFMTGSTFDIADNFGCRWRPAVADGGERTYARFQKDGHAWQRRQSVIQAIEVYHGFVVWQFDDETAPRRGSMNV
ncbi:MAG TPA: hypothetical protein VL017_12030 [Devosia sp.]|nr:hypothetical protein [Devosia sp.]